MQRKLEPDLRAAQRADLAASTQAAIVDVLVQQVDGRARRRPAAIASSSPAASARTPRCAQRLRCECAKRQARVHFPELALCTDNGAMIALAAAMRLQRGIADASTRLRLRRAAALAAASTA